MRATVSHFEIPAEDLERAAAFYRRVFGWRIEPVAGGEPGYLKVRMPSAGQEPPAPVGGGGGIPGGLAAPHLLGAEHPLLVIHVEGIPLERVLEWIVAAGGRVEQPPGVVGTAGSFARFRDPEGNQLGLWAAVEG